MAPLCRQSDKPVKDLVYEHTMIHSLTREMWLPHSGNSQRLGSCGKRSQITHRYMGGVINLVQGGPQIEKDNLGWEKNAEKLHLVQKRPHKRI